MITRTTAYTIDLDRGTVEERWDAPLTYGDKNADKIQVTLMRGSSAATLTGLSAMLYGVRSDGATAIKAGSVSGNVVTVELDYTFYLIPGQLELLLQLTEGTTAIYTPLRISARVKSGQTDEIVSTGEQFSLAQLQAVVSACQTATSEATDATALIRYAFIKWSAANPTSDGDMKTTPDAWIGVYVGTSQTAPTTYTSYQWYQYRGNDGTSAYVHIRWGTSATPATLLTSPAAYIGIANTTSSTAPTTYSGYQWYQYKGDKGDAGVMTYSGTAITGTSATPTVYATGISMAYIGDRYYYNGTTDAQIGNVYRCTLGGNASTALWVYDGNIRGMPGAGSPSDANPLMNGTVSPGAGAEFSRNDHVHPSDTAKLNLSGGNMTGAINESLVSSMAVAGTMNIGAAAGNYIIVTAGTGPITSFDSAPAGARRFMRFSVPATITYNSTYRLIPGAANLDVVSGDVLEWVSGGGGVWRCVNIERWNPSSVRSDISVNLITYTNALQIGITLSTTTTLEQLAAAMPDGSQLIIVPPSSATSNISPSYARYGALTVTRASSSRIYATWNQSTSASVWANTYTGSSFSDWKRLNSNIQSGSVGVSVATGATSGTASVTFSPAFTVAPFVSLTLQATAPGAYTGIYYSVQGVPTASGFTAVVNLGTAPVSTPASITLLWQATENL